MTDPTLERLRELGGDYVLPFQLEESGLRGRYVRLGGAVDQAYPVNGTIVISTRRFS